MKSNAVLLGALTVLVAASGCYTYVTHESAVTGAVVVGTEESEAGFGGLVGWDITTRIEEDMASVVVTAARLYACTRARSEVYDEISTETDTEHVVSGGWYGSVRELGRHDTKTRKTRSLGTTPGTCPQVVANVPIELTLPSGAVLTGATGSDGRASFAIPATEPDYGTALTRVADQRRSATFYKTPLACARVRDEMFSAAMRARAVEERSLLLHAMPTACGDARAQAWSLTATAALDAIGSRCESIEGLGHQVWTIDHELYNKTFKTDPDIAQCLAGREHAECVKKRIELMRQAQEINYPKARMQILNSLPDCDATAAKR